MKLSFIYKICFYTIKISSQKIVPAAVASNAAAVQSEGKPSTNIPETLEADTIYISDSEQ